MLLALVAGLSLTMTRHVPETVARGQAVLVGTPAATAPMELTIELPPRNENGLTALLNAVYDPSSPEFRQYLSVASYTANFGPALSDYRALERYAIANHFVLHAPAANRQVLDVRASVGDVERAFHLRIGFYRDSTQTRTFAAPDREPTFALAVAVLHIEGLDNYTLPVSHKLDAASAPASAAYSQPPVTGSGPGGSYLGSDMRAAYYGGTALSGKGQSLGLYEYPGYNPDDVHAYFANIGQKNHVPIVSESVNDAEPYCSGKKCGNEQSTDIEEAISMAPHLKQLVFYVGYNDISIINQMASDDTSNQFSCSWAFGVDPKEFDPILREMAAQGQSFLSATADNGSNLNGVWPADDQFVTAVGGSALTTNGPGGTWKREDGWADGGGGPSPNGIHIPSYQKPFVTTRNGASSTLRNVPDVAMNADFSYYSCDQASCGGGMAGTSYAAPLWTGYIALANEYAAETNKPPLGFINPALYRIGASSAYAELFHDQTVGYNGGYHNEPGYDLVTGFGTPDGDSLIESLVDGD